nr:DotU family type IV/VI secretion system protein [uncultured Pseudomonas sp.]
MSEQRLANCWVGVMHNARHLIAEPTANAAAVNGALVAQLDNAASRARDLHHDEAQVREALFAVVAWIDETAMTQSWPGAAEWRRAPLQRHYFSTTRAGVEFFQRLEALPESATGAREVFGLALLAGFAGQLATRPGGELADYRRLVLQRIARDGQMQPLDAFSPLFSQPQMAHTPRRAKIRRRLPGIALLLLVVVPVVALAALYIGLDRPLAAIAAQLMGTR